MTGTRPRSQCSSTRPSTAGRVSCWRKPTATHVLCAGPDERQDILSRQFIRSANWSKGFRKNGQPIPNPAKEPWVALWCRRITAERRTGPLSAYDPNTKLFYVNTVEGYSLHYRLHAEDEKVARYGGDSEHLVGGLGAALRAIDPKTGKLQWIHPYPGAEGSAGLVRNLWAGC